MSKLIISIVLDIIGVFPLFFGLGDIIYAPIQGLWIKYAYGTTLGAVLSGLEELLPFTDIIPSCTIIHILSLIMPGKFDGIYTDLKGYKRYKDSNKLVHRVVASNKIGGKIGKDRVVHHIDGNKGNFRKNNLKIMSRRQHSKLHAYNKK